MNVQYKTFKLIFVCLKGICLMMCTLKNTHRHSELCVAHCRSQHLGALRPSGSRFYPEYGSLLEKVITLEANIKSEFIQFHL